MLRANHVCLSIALVAACGTDVRPPDGTPMPNETSLAAIRSNIFTTSCGFGSCHAGSTPAAHLDLRNGDLCGALVNHASCLFPNKLLVVPGKPEQSFLLDKLNGTNLSGTPAPGCADSNEPMPFGAPPLSADKIAQIEQWIRNGASCDATGDAGVPSGTGDAAEGPPADVASISAAAATLRAGQHTQLTITLAHPAPAGGQTIDLDVEDPTVLGVPSAMHVAAGASTLAVDVIAKRPSHPVGVSAVAGSTTKTVAIGVTGLVLSEIEFDPISTDDGYEWIEIANTSDVAIDLGAYSLGSGRTSYTYTLAQLSGTIPAHGCFVVGGPNSDHGAVYSQTFNFSPDLINGSGTNGQAAGFALFDVPITQVVLSSVPLDAVLCGINNLAGLVDARGVAATPSCPDVAAGHSVSRTTSTSWVDQPSPTPNVCSLH
ncbi:MAG TPA: lamin tail domain-containing protein [Kofleriaceae bacterium]